MDRISPEQRRSNMQRIRSKHTRPELLVRKLIYHMGYRYRLHDPNLPGKPDIVFRKLKKVIFVHGCFWHRHEGCHDALLPSSNQNYWIPKLNNNCVHDRQNQDALFAEGWHYLIIWECQLVDSSNLSNVIMNFLVTG
ncbi:MAG: very short patch repair endonuclease [Dehalococcoidia bacterium]